MDALWAHTQIAALHERWDLRFSRIEYLSKSHADHAQRFRYSTRIGFGYAVSGEGETVGERALADGCRSSALRFGSREPLSIIREGCGYWKYMPTSDGIRFLTRYDYQTRFGVAGTIFDRMIFRPLIAWATAWSFDRLRLWLEQHVDPAHAMRQTLVHIIARLALATIFAYHGIVPKLVNRHADEMAMLADAGVAGRLRDVTLTGLAISETAFAAALLVAGIDRGRPYCALR